MNKFEKRSRDAYNKKALDYDDTFEGKFTAAYNRLLLEAVGLQDGDAVLDVACGNGRLLKMLAGRHAIRGYGIDISENMVAQAKLQNPDMEFTACSCEHLPYPDAVMDAITVSAAYHHFPHVDIFAREALRVLKPKGKIYIAEVYYPLCYRVLFTPLLPLLKEGDVKFYSPEAIIRTLTRAGFAVPAKLLTGRIQLISARKG
ncbi:Ubiquinone/menaquinone biosynthesis C-methyltransferase UbiE [bioreactor metagenome]|uniref:Ubiquinone/menaquinone biosynthesis C-methyltransferase UbiE n=1 Tax=bioreactor metagenome TaxID=1076179 RepID=A0A644WXS7_9ZZZZ